MGWGEWGREKDRGECQDAKQQNRVLLRVKRFECACSEQLHRSTRWKPNSCHNCRCLFFPTSRIGRSDSRMQTQAPHPDRNQTYSVTRQHIPFPTSSPMWSVSIIIIANGSQGIQVIIDLSTGFAVRPSSSKHRTVAAAVGGLTSRSTRSQLSHVFCPSRTRATPPPRSLISPLTNSLSSPSHHFLVLVRKSQWSQLALT